MTFRRRMRRRFNAEPGVECLETRALLTPGANLAFYEFANHTTATPELFSSDTHSDTVASDISSPLSLGWTGNGEPPNGLALGGAFNETAEPTPGGGEPDYFELTISPNAGYLMNVAAFSLQVRRNDPDSKNSFAVYFDDDPGSGGNNFTTKILSGVLTSEDRFDSFSVNVEGMSEFAGKTTPVTFRVYAWGTEGTGTMRLDNIRVQSVQEKVSSSEFAYYGDADRLIHPLNELGNRIPDFSAAGYMYGNEPIPDVTTTIDASRVVTVAPVAGDDMATIQLAINQVGAMSPDANGFRGVVQLTAGEYQVSDQIQILNSGVVLRGVGDGESAADSTILRATGTHQRSVVVIGAASGFVTPVSGTTHNITDKYVPVGATSFQVDSTSGWVAGDEVVVMRPGTAQWISDIGMDMIPERADGGTVIQWSPGGNFDQPYERIITRIEGDRIFLNAPLTNAIEEQYGGGTVFKYTFPRINRVGVENIRGVSDFAFDTDEDHARTFVELQAVQNAWVTNVTGVHFVFATVHATSRSRMVTIDGAASLDPKSIITGARRYPFVIDGQFTLMKNLYSEEGRHDFVNNSSWRNRGPNVFLNGTAVNSHSATGPHQRWSTGTLYDTIVTDNQIEARNRGNFGSGHGWGGANFVYWNSVADSFIVQNPPTAQNWVIGSTGTLLDETRFGPQPPATVDAHDTPVDFGRADNPTSSLFVAQLNQRLAMPLEEREYVLGDYDLGDFDGAGSADLVSVDTAWLTAATGLASGQNVSAFDTSAGIQYVPGSFSYSLTNTERVVAATLTLGLRSSGGDTTSDVLRLDRPSNLRTFASLGLTDSLSVSATTAVTIELVGNDLDMLQDGLLNLLVSENTVVDWAALKISVGEVDLVSTAFAVDSQHIPLGRADLTFTLQNAGGAAATEFETHVVWSPNDVIGDADDVVITGSQQTFAGLAGGKSLVHSFNVQLDRAALFPLAVAAAPAGNPVGTESAEVSHLFLVVDSRNDVSESSEANNSGNGQGIDREQIRNFPWDKNSNGTVEPLEAIHSIRAIGTTDPASDFDGNGIVTPLEALSTVQRIGYVQAAGFGKRSSRVSAEGNDLITASITRHAVASLSASEQDSYALTGPLKNVAFAWPGKDDEEESVYSLTSGEAKPASFVPAAVDDDHDALADFERMDWLSFL